MLPMPSRSAHRAALRRSQEPSVIAPDGVTLPELPANMNWLNPVRGDRFDRDEWNLLLVGAGETVVIARIQRERPGQTGALLTLKGGSAMPTTLPIAQAFVVAAEFARSSSR